MSSREIEDVLASIRRLVSDDLRPANRPHAAGALLLTPALRVVPQSSPTTPAAKPVADITPPATIQPDWVPDQSTLSAVAGMDTEHLDFQTGPGEAIFAEHGRGPLTRSAMQSAAEAFHAHDDEFVLSLSDSGSMMLRGDGATAQGSDTSVQGHGAVFVVLTQGAAPVHVPPTAALIDAEGGAPIEDDAPWAVVEWDDPAATSAPLRADPGPGDAPAQATGATAPIQTETGRTGATEPLVLPFVSTRRSGGVPTGGTPGVADPLILRAAATPKTPGDPVAGPDLVPTPEAPPAVANATLTLVDALIVPDDVPDAERFYGERALTDIADADLVEDARDTGVRAVEPVEASPATENAADPVVAAPEAVAPAGDAVAPDGTATGAQLATGAEPVAAGTARVKKAHRRFNPAPAAEGPPATDSAPITNVFDAAETTSPSASPDTTSDDAPATASPKPAPRLSEAAFTRWPGWAQSAPDEKPDLVAVTEIAPASVASPPAATGAVAPHKKHKIPAPDVSWADRAEAEIHRMLAAELGLVAMDEVVAKVPDLPLSQADLRDLVRKTIREELAGKLGERITANVRKLVQMELQRTLAGQVAEFRSQRRETISDR